jgi:hypothetical protein
MFVVLLTDLKPLDEVDALTRDRMACFRASQRAQTQRR